MEVLINHTYWFIDFAWFKIWTCYLACILKNLDSFGRSRWTLQIIRVHLLQIVFRFWNKCKWKIALFSIDLSPTSRDQIWKIPTPFERAYVNWLTLQITLCKKSIVAFSFFFLLIRNDSKSSPNIMFLSEPLYDALYATVNLKNFAVEKSIIQIKI